MMNSSKNKIQVLPEIRGTAFKVAREKLQLTPADLGVKACLSKKHIVELEEGGISSFYSEAHKITVAKKVAKILGLDESKVLVHPDGDAVVQNSLEFDLVPSESSVEEGVSEDAKSQQVNRSGVTRVALPSEDKVSLFDLSPSHMTTGSGRQGKSLRGIGALFLILAVVFGLYFTKDDIAQVFASKPKTLEPEAVAESVNPPEEVPPVASVTPPLSAVVDTVDPACPKVDSLVTDYSVTEPSKSGNFVFVQAKVKQVVCVVDASGQSIPQTIEAGSNYTFTGKAPFTVLSNGFQQLSVFYQGRPVRPSNTKVRSLRLIEAK
jgi:DNA-binding XRE family transcriptional regulator